MGKKKICFCVMIVLLGISLPVVAMAQTSSRKANIKSKGNLDFENGTVYFSASDLTYLADEIDHLEYTYKTTVVSALNRIGTFFRNDGTITYDASKNEADTESEQNALSFGVLTEGILRSQSVEHLKNSQVKDKEGNLLFYTSQEAANQKDMNSLTTTNTGLPAYYKPAGADNLTAGTTAWVNGQLLKGNGYDKSASYSQGWIDGMANAVNNLNISYTIIHNHEGTDTSGTGCYTELNSSTPVYGNHQAAAHDADDKVYCKHCGAFMGDPVQASDGHWYTDWNNKRYEKCSRNLVRYDTTYSLSCGKEEGQTWTTQNTLKMGTGDTIYSATIVY